MDDLMSYFRNMTADTLCGLSIKVIEDYEKGTQQDLTTGDVTALTLPRTNLIRFVFDEGFIALRPSGTEPKMKVYFSLECNDLESIIAQFQTDYLERT